MPATSFLEGVDGDSIFRIESHYRFGSDTLESHTTTEEVMPNRDRLVKVLVQDILGAQVWDGLSGAPRNMPVEDYDRVEAAMEGLVVRVVQAVDWSRLLAEASWRHTDLHEGKVEGGRKYSEATGVCGECLAEALLQDRTGAPDWGAAPKSPRPEVVDWPQAIVDTIKHREATYWHPFKGVIDG